MVERADSSWSNFGSEVRQFRRQSGLTLKDLAQQLRVSPQMVGAMERGTRKTRGDIAEKLDELLATNGVLIRRWSEVTKNDGSPVWHTDIVRVEEQASEIHYVNPTLIPGVMQTRAYAKVIFADGRPLDPPAEIDRLAQLRVQRLAQLQQQNAPRITGVISEVVIQSKVGGGEVHREQISHLLDLAESGEARILVVPTSAAYHGAASGAYQLLRFPDRQPLIYSDHAGGGVFLDEDAEVQRCTAVLQELLAWALSPSMTIDLLREVRDGTT